ncbi:LrgB family protein [Sulfurospirillum multivorans]|uniref:Membrane protein, YohK-like n=2 Tax=Sulfurospirillum multivorans TaxID=66821 RepID=A0AA86DZ81_SULMK|nr:LrgB family protein [Sulfurospirillum multivorans]AHJ12165.1 putative membrane protein, YohK-like [Sulfurospirillum multivorans DSM 12446]QEH05665.1 putative membrane protein, YohK-like [Sulfurospirillum multivorans]
MNVDALIAYVMNTPLSWIIITMSAYKIGIIIYEKTGKHALLQPIVIAYVIMLPILILAQIPYKQYFESVSILHFFLGPATVALALPLYKNLKLIQSYFLPILITLVAGGIFTILSAISILWLFGASKITMLSMTTKSVTAPITLITAQDIGAIPSLAMGFVVITGLLGALFGTFIFKLLKIKHDAAKGFALGLISHAVGTARAFEISENAAAFSALAMGLIGVFIAVLLPIVIGFL